MAAPKSKEAGTGTGRYRFRWADENDPQPGPSRFAELKRKAETVFAKLLARCPDRVLDSVVVRWTVMTTLPVILRLCCRPGATYTLSGSEMDRKVAVVAVYADGSEAALLVHIRRRRVAVSSIPVEQVPKRADSAIIMRFPVLLRMFFGADMHPALLISNGDIKLWGDLFITARLIPILGIPTRSLLSDNRTQRRLLDHVTTKNNPVSSLTAKAGRAHVN